MGNEVFAGKTETIWASTMQSRLLFLLCQLIAQKNLLPFGCGAFFMPFTSLLAMGIPIKRFPDRQTLENSLKMPSKGGTTPHTGYKIQSPKSIRLQHTDYSIFRLALVIEQ